VSQKVRACGRVTCPSSASNSRQRIANSRRSGAAMDQDGTGVCSCMPTPARRRWRGIIIAFRRIAVASELKALAQSRR